MAKETVTEYETAEKSITKIQCDHCDKEWDDRSADDLNMLVLDCTIDVRKYSRHTSWRSYSFDKNRSMMGDPCKISGESKIDICDSCLSSNLPEKYMIEVEQSDYYVEEKTIEKYICDFCEEEMGESLDHEVFINPRILLYPNKKYRARAGRSGSSLDDISPKGVINNFEEVARYNSKDEVIREIGEKLDCCESCANDLFRKNAHQSTDAYNNEKSWLSVLKDAMFGL